MKICKDCKELLDLTKFNSKGYNTKKSGERVKTYRSKCANCYKVNKAHILDAIVVEIFNKYACSKCGYDRCKSAIDFHHLEPSEKEYNPSSIRRRDSSVIRKELMKCIILCSNCHRELHARL